MFKTEAENDKSEVQRLSQELDEAARIALLAGYAKLEGKLLIVQRVHSRLEQISAKYAAAAREDEKTREYLRDAAIARVNRPAPPSGRR